MSIQLSIGPRVRKSPFFESARRSGMTSASVYNHMFLPTSYGDPDSEYDALINRVVMWDASAERQIALKGKDALHLGAYLTGRNLERLKIGQGKYAPLCNFSGTLINDPVLQQVDEDELWFSIADADIGLWVCAIAGQLNLRVNVFEPDVSPLAIQGPLAEHVVIDLFGSWVTELKYFGFQRTSLNNIPIVLARSGWSKQGGFELYLCDSKLGEKLWFLVKEAGNAYGMIYAAPNYIERLESGLISIAADTDDLSNPFEFNLERFIDLDQSSEFIGKKALRRIRDEGIKRRFVGLLIDTPKFFSLNENKLKAFQGRKEVGYVSSTAFSPRLNSNIGIGMIHTEAIESGNPIEFKLNNQSYQAEIRALPIIQSFGQ